MAVLAAGLLAATWGAAAAEAVAAQTASAGASANSGFAAAEASADVSPLPMEAIAPGVWWHRGRVEDWGAANGGDVANLGLVVGDRCAAVIDTGGTPTVGARLRAAVRQRTSLPLCYVINTHVHQDHVLGNRAFVDAGPDGTRPRFVGHAKLAAALAGRGRYMLMAVERSFGTRADEGWLVAPDVSVTDRTTLDLGGRRLTLVAWPTAHTDNDLSVRDEASGTLFLGDLLFQRHLPVIDGSLNGWLAVIAQLRDTPAQVVVPGHGDLGRRWPEALDAEETYLRSVRDATRAALKQKIGLRDTVERAAPPSGDWQLVDLFHRRNVTAAYAELEWED